MTVINTESYTDAAGCAISQAQFTVGNSSLVPTAFTQIQGTLSDLDGSAGTAISAIPPGSAEDWSFLAPSSGTKASVWTVNGNGLNGYGGQPQDMIVANANYTSPPPALGNFDLSFIGAVNFYFAVPANFTTADVTGANFSFGTGPEVGLMPGTLVPSSSSETPPATAIIPEPSSAIVWWLLAMLGLGIGLSVSWHKRVVHAAA